jgi:hypothetical protein
MLCSDPALQGSYPAGAVRRYPRILFSIPCTVHHLARGGVRSSRAVSLDVSENGLGALVEGRLQVGDMVGIELPLPDCQLKAVAIVRHTSSWRSGFEFFGLTPEERAHLATIVGRA